jgi:site-specific DNA-methyltransferase (adenine-specific)
VAHGRHKARTFDILNAGPRHRFTVSGQLVSNCGFGGGVGALRAMALAYRIHLDPAEARRIVDAWRGANSWAPVFWNALWDAAMTAWETPGLITSAGRIHFVFYENYLGGTLFMELPSGRLLTYPQPKWREVDVKDKDGNPTGEKRTELSFQRARGRAKLWFGTLCENSVQGTAANILRHTVTRIETNSALAFMPIRMTTHDEIVCEVDEARAEEAKAILRREMLTVSEWAEGLPLQSEEQICRYYTKSKAALEPKTTDKALPPSSTPPPSLPPPLPLLKPTTKTCAIVPGDCRETLAALAENSFDACVTDSPYSLASIVKRFGKPESAPAKYGVDGCYQRASAGFMGQQWDTGETAFDPAFWAEVLRVLKPGANLIAMGGTRTFHRLGCAIETAGFEIYDTIVWCHAQGFPKRGTLLKPAVELCALARKPLSEPTFAANVARWGTGGLNIEACRIPGEGGRFRNGEASQDRRYTVNGSTNFAALPGPRGGDPDGRWPANLILDESEEAAAIFPSGQSRCFYSVKANKADRAGSLHPTVKPVALLRYLIRLVVPPGGIVLDPFAGSGTTGEAAALESRRSILIERETAYVTDIERRMVAVEERAVPR